MFAQSFQITERLLSALLVAVLVLTSCSGGDQGSADSEGPAMRAQQSDGAGLPDLYARNNETNLLEIEVLQIHPAGVHTTIDFRLTNRSVHTIESWGINVEVFGPNGTRVARAKKPGARLQSGRSATETCHFANVSAAEVASCNFTIDVVHINRGEGRPVNATRYFDLVRAGQ